MAKTCTFSPLPTPVPNVPFTSCQIQDIRGLRGAFGRFPISDGAPARRTRARRKPDAEVAGPLDFPIHALVVPLDRGGGLKVMWSSAPAAAGCMTPAGT